jgi:hypothetical protein
MGLFDRNRNRDDQYRGQTGSTSSNLLTADQVNYLDTLRLKGTISDSEYADALNVYQSNQNYNTAGLSTGITSALQYGYPEYAREQSYTEAEQPAPQGLFDRSPPGFSYAQAAPPSGYKYAYSADGQRYTVPEAYEYASRSEYETAITGTPLGGDPIEGQTFGPYDAAGTGDTGNTVYQPANAGTGTTTGGTGSTGGTGGTGNTNMADDFGTASDVAKTVLEGGAAPQQVTYGATLTPQDDRQIIDTEGKFVDGTISPTAAQATTSQATMPDQFGVAQATTQTTVGGVEDVVANTQAATGTVSQTMDAATKDPYSTAVSGAPGAAQISQPTRVEAPEPLAVTPEMLVSGVADARVASAFAEEVQAAQAQPSEKATVQGQLVNLMAQFEEGDTPAWAAGAMRQATAMMAQRGMSASSLAGQAIIQAAMESALPIAQADAQTQAQFESQNLSNRQQRAMLAAQQRAQFIGQEFDQAFQARVQNAARVADIAGINFNAQQQIALENARIANSVDLANLNNKQARIMAEVAQIASLESQNLNNRQQAAQQNAQAFLQMDMANLSNQQQTELFKSQSRIQALFTDAAAENAASQFNASSQNQVNQFFANLFSQTSQFNATQENAISQFNADQRNVITRFTEEINNQREQFNASNRLVIDQANANWFRNVATADTAAINFANNQSVGNLLAFTTTSLNNMYQAERDMIEQAWTSGENDLERATDIILQRIVGEIELAVADKESSAKDSNTIGQWIRDIIGWM